MLLRLLTLLAISIKPLVEEFGIDVVSHAGTLGSVTIDWSSYDYFDKVFKVYRSSDNQKFETVPIDYTTVEEVKCLHVYPHPDAENQLKNWAKDYGQGKINIESVSLSEFNSHPLDYIKRDVNRDWTYDVIFFGTWDYNNNTDISDAVVEPLKEFIENGQGVIFGHDTACITTGYNNSNFNQFADYIGITLNSSGSSSVGTQVFVGKTGLLTSYPYNFTTGVNFTVPTTHCTYQVVNNKDNINFYLVSSALQSNPEANAYLVTNNSVAMIQTGHSNGAATEDEQKIIMNLIFYCKQLTISDCNLTDYGSIDYEPPEAPSVIGTFGKFRLYANDRGTLYTYFVESFNKDDTSSQSVVGRSETRSISVSSGIKGFRYIFDTNINTEVNEDNSKFTDSNIIYSSKLEGYLHVCAVDFVGNIGPTTTIELRYEPLTCEHQQNPLSIVCRGIISIVIKHKN